MTISKELREIFNFALVWGRSTKHNPQRVGLSHVLTDEDVVQIVPKTLVQQKHSKDYQARVILCPPRGVVFTFDHCRSLWRVHIHKLPLGCSAFINMLPISFLFRSTLTMRKF